MANKTHLSDDGSHTLISSKFGTSYHSTFGALTESQTVFIQAGLEYIAKSKNQDKIRIFEMGYGTGLNALLAAFWSTNHNRKISYHSIEAYPISDQEFSTLNYGKLLGLESLYQDLHSAKWDEEIPIHIHYSLKKIKGLLEQYPLTEEYDLIFYDAFGPGTQEHLWGKNITDKLYSALAPRGVLTTYCAKGSFKRNLKASGFMVEGLPGPPGKREITRAIKS